MRWILLALGLASGCAPILHTHHHTLQSFESTRPCGQGPFVFEVEGTGARWSEGVHFNVYSPHDVTFQWEATLEGQVINSGTLGSRRLVPDADEMSFKNIADGVDNAHCLRTDPIPVQVVTAPTPKPSMATTPPEQTAMSTGPLLKPNEEIPPLNIGPWLTKTGRGWLFIQPVTLENRDPALRALADGATIRIVLWSIAPNDLRDVRFFVEHWSRAPRSDENYVAWLDKKQARIDARWERQRLRVSEHRPRRAKRSQRRIKRAKKRRPIQRPVSPKPTVATETIQSAPAPVVAPGRPPYPVPEVVGDAPYIGATWTPGYWHWHQTQWLWIAGWWSGQERVVPQTVPPAPIPPQTTVQAVQPTAPAVYIRGHWSLGVNGMRWIHGGWHLEIAVE
jgi:hypothetical protein